jgi:hypothetical protein
LPHLRIQTGTAGCARKSRRGFRVASRIGWPQAMDFVTVRVPWHDRAEQGITGKTSIWLIWAVVRATAIHGMVH